MPRSLVVMLAAVSLVACGGAAEEAGRPANMPEPTPPGNAPMVMQEEQPLMQSQVEQPTAPPRLSHVVTLGQESYAPMPEAGGVGQQGGPNITINNYSNAGPGYGGYAYGYGYGGAGYGRGYYRGAGGYTTNNPTFAASHAAGGAGTWGATGWEGAGRTAAYGHTPNVGGNYAAPSSAGPRAMR